MATTVITGRLTADPEVKDGWVSFSVAENHTKEKTSFFPCRAHLSDEQIKFMKKGSEVVVSGDLSYTKNTKDDKIYTNLDVFVYNVKFVGGKKEEQSE